MNTAQTIVARAKGEAVQAGVLLPAMLAMNTLALFAIDALQGIPEWIKVSATLFLQF